MVHNLCRRLLRRAADADDAFQATFLILVRKAGSIARGASLAGWLYRVAYRVAQEARAREARSAAAPYEDEFSDPRSVNDAERRELRRAVAEEVDRLPEKYRLPVVLCYLSGQTTEEAARRLGCPRGTVLSRLASARRRLHGRLLRRGVVATAGAAAAVLGRKAAADVPASLVSATVKSGLWVAAGGAGGAAVVSGSVLSLMEGALKAMLMKKLKWAAAFLTAAALVGSGVGLWFRQTAVAEPPIRTRYEEPAKAVDEPRAARVPESPRPIGTWEREVGPIHMTMRIEADHIYGACSGVEKEGKFEFALDADYSVTRDNLLYGVITGVDVDGNVRGDGGDGWKEALYTQLFLNDQPFSLRYRLDDNVLTIKAVKFGDIKETNAQDKDNQSLFLLGRWKKKTESARDTAR